MIGWILITTLIAQAAPSLPPRAKALEGKQAALSGPNCWNSALYSAGLVSGIRHVDYEEFSAWLGSPLCKEVMEKNSRGGEIVALRRARPDGRLVDFPYTAEIHGYLLLAPGIAFTKNGVGAADGYQVQDVASLHAKYEATNKKECRMLGLPKELCGMKAQYYHCAPNSTLSSLESLKLFEAKIDALEDELHQLYSVGTVSDSLEQEKSRIKAQVDSLQLELDAAAAGNDNWQTELLRLRLVSARIFQF